MKTLLIFVCVVVANVQGVEVIREMLRNALEDCKSKVQVSPDDIKLLIEHKPVTSDSAKCLVACFNKKMKIQSADGALDPKSTREAIKLIKHFSEEIYQKAAVLIDKCLEQVHEGENECEIGYSFFTCTSTTSELFGEKFPISLSDIL